ncbi:MAG: TGS domain-containing protein, partial [Firmicutes bacterium]|nr:TGS domain-containing protein [Bacillota bacterium]
MINITMQDGSVRRYQPGTSLLEIARDISPRLAKESLVARVDENLADLNARLDRDARVEFLTFDSEEGRETFRHSASHVMAQAVQRLFPGTRLAIGPPIADGFYYDFDSPHKFTPDELEKIEAEINKIIKEDLPFSRVEIAPDEALRRFGDRQEQYKIELVNDLPKDAVISCYRQGEFEDLCAGPHVPSTGRLKAVKLLNLAGAYWRGDER